MRHPSPERPARPGPSCGCSGENLCATHYGRRKADVLKTSWPCVSCGGSGHNATLRGRTRCLQCDGIGIDLLSVAVELVRRSNDRTALIASIERAEATCARLAATQQHHADHGHEACACHSFMTEVSTVIGDVTAAISSREVDEA